MSKIGDILEGTIVRVYPRYAIMLFDNGETGLLHISELSKRFVVDLPATLLVGSIHKVKVIEIDEKNHSMKVSKKKLDESERHHYLKKKKVPYREADFTALRDNLAKWIEEENSSQQ